MKDVPVQKTRIIDVLAAAKLPLIAGSLAKPWPEEAFRPLAPCESFAHCAVGELLFAAGLTNAQLDALDSDPQEFDDPTLTTLYTTYGLNRGHLVMLVGYNDEAPETSRLAVLCRTVEGLEDGAFEPAPVEEEDAVGAWNPYFAHYAAAHGLTPDAVLAHDRDRWPGGAMVGFQLWISRQRERMRAAQPEAFHVSWNLRVTDQIIDYAAWGRWLAQAAVDRDRLPDFDRNCQLTNTVPPAIIPE